MSGSLKFYHFSLVSNNFRKLIQVSSWQQNECDAVVQASECSLPEQQAAGEQRLLASGRSSLGARVREFQTNLMQEAGK